MSEDTAVERDPPSLSRTPLAVIALVIVNQADSHLVALFPLIWSFAGCLCYESSSYLIARTASSLGHCWSLVHIVTKRDERPSPVPTTVVLGTRVSVKDV